MHDLPALFFAYTNDLKDQQATCGLPTYVLSLYWHNANSARITAVQYSANTLAPMSSRINSLPVAYLPVLPIYWHKTNSFITQADRPMAWNWNPQFWTFFVWEKEFYFCKKYEKVSNIWKGSSPFSRSSSSFISLHKR